MSFNLASLNAGLQRIASAADTLLGGDETVTLRHTGLTVTVPYAPNEGKTVATIFAEQSGELSIPGGAKPNVTSPGIGSVDLTEKVCAGRTYDAFTDKKENAAS